jgi:hypothetical protein
MPWPSQVDMPEVTASSTPTPEEIASEGAPSAAQPTYTPSTPTAPSLTPDKLRKALLAALNEALDGRELDLDLSINEREFRGLIDDRIDAKLT